MAKNNRGDNAPKQTRKPRAKTIEGTEQNEPGAGAGEAVQVTTDGDQIPPVETGEAIFSDEEKENAVDGEWVAEKIGPYLEAYPQAKEFHITSDGQVFLGANKPEAKEHQKHLNDGKDVVSFTVENE